MIPAPTQLLAEIENGEIPLADIFSNADCDSLLDQRDFDSSFNETCRELRDRNEKFRFILNRDPAEKIRQQSFAAASTATRQHKIASQVSEDFELIAWESYLLANDDTQKSGSPFIEWLYSQYKSGRFPRPPYSDGNPNGNGG